MSKRILAGLSAAALLVSGAALAQTSGTLPGAAAGTTSGPAAGKNAEPSTAIQKQEGRSAEEMKAPAGAAAPGVEAKPGSEGGAMQKKDMDSMSK